MNKLTQRIHPALARNDALAKPRWLLVSDLRLREFLEEKRLGLVTFTDQRAAGPPLDQVDSDTVDWNGLGASNQVSLLPTRMDEGK